MTRFVLWMSMGILIAGSSAWAGAGARKQDSGPQLKNHLLTTRARDLQLTADELAAKAQATNEEFGKATDKYLSQLEKAEKLRKDADEQFQNAQKALLNGDEKLVKLNSDITEIEQRALRGSLSTADQTKLTKLMQEKTSLTAEVQQARVKAEDLRADQERATKYLEEVRGKIQTTYKPLIGPSARVETPEDIEGLRKQVASAVRQQQLRDVENVTNQLFDKVESDYFKTGLLTADLKHLETKYEMTGERMDILKRIATERLNRTMLGDYVNSQIAKAMGNLCALRAQCDSTSSTEEKVRGISDVIRKLLQDPAGSMVPEGATVPAEPATPPAKPPTRAQPALQRT